MPEGRNPSARGAWPLLIFGKQRPPIAIGTKFPTYLARHPRKVTWLVHQHRAAYELAGTPYSDFTHDERDVALRERLIALDTGALSESRTVQYFENDRESASALQRTDRDAAVPSAAPGRAPQEWSCR